MKWSPFALLLYVIGSSAQSTPPSPDTPAARTFDSGMRAFGSRNFAAAANDLGALCRQYSTSAQCASARLPLATALFLSSRYAEAIDALESLPESDRRSSEALHMMATSQVYVGQLDAALRTFATLYGLPPDSAEARLLAARMMIRLERETEAEAILRRLLVSNPALPTANYYLGVVFLGRSLFEEAAAAFRREVRVNPTYSDAYYKLGDAFGRKQEWKAAIPPLQMAIWLNPDQSGPYILLGKAYLSIGSVKNAEAILNRAIGIDPNNSAAKYMLAQLLTRAGRHVEAKSLFDRIRRGQE